MTPDELRALADALSSGTHHVESPELHEAMMRAADYLRAQADAQPVAWRTYDGEGNYNYRDYELNEDYADEWNRRNPKHVGWVEPLYIHPAPAAPQAEPKREPLSEWRIGELHRQWLANPETVTIADLMRAVERAHGIRGSDE